jgi:seryl-tRNA synthetase
MHDIRAIRDAPATLDAALARRGLEPVSARILAIDKARRANIAAAEKALAERNAASTEIGAAKARGDDAAFTRLRTLVTAKKADISNLEADAKAEDSRLRDMLMGLPNMVHDDVPDGTDEADNIEVHRFGNPPEFPFTAREHYQLPAARGLDFETAAKLSGSRFVVLRGAMARLHRALGQFMLDMHINQHGLSEIITPVLVRETAMFGTGQLPKFAVDSYQTSNGWWLIPTAEVTLTNTVAGLTLDAADLPVRLTALTQCFRSEAGSAGKDTAGMLRQHQFEKVEMVSITHPDHSESEHRRMTDCAQNILQALELPYRTVELCTGDIGFGARRTYDIEVWLPGQNTYREISSISSCGDFQARRMNARFRAPGEKPAFVHTLNGSGLAIGRTLIAVLENGQQADGSVNLPTVLHSYLGGRSIVTADGNLS